MNQNVPVIVQIFNQLCGDKSFRSAKGDTLVASFEPNATALEVAGELQKQNIVRMTMLTGKNDKAIMVIDPRTVHMDKLSEYARQDKQRATELKAAQRSLNIAIANDEGIRFEVTGKRLTARLTQDQEKLPAVQAIYATLDRLTGGYAIGGWKAIPDPVQSPAPSKADPGEAQAPSTPAQPRDTIIVIERPDPTSITRQRNASAVEGLHQIAGRVGGKAKKIPNPLD